ncbi:poly-beta-1,6-N-acetyl-D-glucosamine biosynthesis protein PgaD [Propionivibrio sp.]|uniref:poly-beta-1,6-N-acetyl-D-glucosamine biosynthesis protein PgaD n=1 Tax=Propionivibrio sp. TaxID=2212460 RepID=UPI00272E1535|nr:poly-beta-1,6-N-acetyl-D-glucosamine biosynthesis protein PgaD [Propionivibrio sp.]
MSLPPHIRIRCADGHPLIFRRPEGQPKTARNAMLLATGIGWSVWLYLWRPLLTLFLWYWGGEIAENQWIELAGLNGLVDFAYHVMPFGIALCALLLAWALTNYLRFRGRERRKARPLSSTDADARWTRISPAALENGRKVKNLVCWHDDDGILLGFSEACAESSHVVSPTAGSLTSPPNHSGCIELQSEQKRAAAAVFPG